MAYRAYIGRTRLGPRGIALIRRYGDAPKAGQKYEVRTGVYAILPRNSQLLLTWQGEPHSEVQLPGGGVDPGESPIHALHREVFEETGWRISTPMKLGAFRRFTFMPEYNKWAEKVCHIYLARPVKKLSAPSETNHMPLWMDQETAIRNLCNDGDAAFVASLL